MPSTPALFTPIKVGAHQLQHRVVLAPLTRTRATLEGHVPINPMVKTYYSQRASRPGTLLISEGTFISPQAGGWDNVPGIWSQEQVNAWKEVTDAVHSKGSVIFLQIAGLGRGAQPQILKREGFSFVGPSPIPIDPTSDDIPRELTLTEINEYIQLFAQAAKNAVEGAGFDGVEVHGANGFLVDEFLQDNSNQRTDRYGGSIENRSRFPLEVIDAVAKAIGEEKVGLKISPWNPFQGMRMKDPIPQFTHFVRSLRAAHPNLAYLHALEPDRHSLSAKNSNDFRSLRPDLHPLEADHHSLTPEDSNDFLRVIWRPKPLITGSEYTRETAIKTAEEKGDLIAFGRLFISNPDLPTRLEKNIPLTEPDAATFYTHDEEGYTTYPFAELSD